MKSEKCVRILSEDIDRKGKNNMKNPKEGVKGSAQAKRIHNSAGHLALTLPSVVPIGHQ